MTSAPRDPHPAKPQRREADTPTKHAKRFAGRSVDLERMPLHELRDLAASQGVEGAESMGRAALVALLRP